MFTGSLIALLFAAQTCLAIPTTWPKVLHERREIQSNHLRQGSRVHQNAVLSFRIALTQSNLEDGYSHLTDVSHPGSEKYGKHWTQEEVREAFAPSNKAVDTVREWLVSSRVPSHHITQTANKGWLEFHLPVHKAERLFSTKYFEHEDHTDGTVKIGCDHYSLPEHIAPYVDYITPGVALSPPLAKRTFERDAIGDWVHKPFATDSELESKKKPVADDPTYSDKSLPKHLRHCGSKITPDCIRALYDIPKATLSDAANALGVFEYVDVYAQGSLDSFFAKYSPNVPNGTHPELASIGRGKISKAPVALGYDDGESDIDLQMAYSLIYPQQITLYQTAPTPYNVSYLENGGFHNQGVAFGQATNNLLDAIDGVSTSEFCFLALS